MSGNPTLHVITPTYRPAGGVVKIMDYVTHALDAGFSVSIFSPEQWAASLPLFQIDRFANLIDNPDVEFHRRRALAIRSRDLVFISLPDDFEMAYRSLPHGMSPERIIHIVQNVRHANPSWRRGYPLRLLTRPAARISVNGVVGDVIQKWLDPRGFHEVIPIGHDVDYFSRIRSEPIGQPIKVAYATWKSDLGDRVRAQLDGDRRFEFKAITEVVEWGPLRELYHWADVFLASPGPEEGPYLPCVEAMSAGCLVITPDAGGNMEYCVPDENCLLVGYESEDQYVEALRSIEKMDPVEVDAFRDAGYRTTPAFSLTAERAGFQSFLAQLWDRICKTEGGKDLG